MCNYLANALSRLSDLLRSKAVPPVLTGGQWSGTSFIDSYRRNRTPTPNEILAELKNTAWTCASLNASVCASNPPRLYVRTQTNQARPKCLTKSLSAATEKRLRSTPHLAVHTKSAERLEEVTEHPLLDLLAQVNPVHNQFDLWELTTLYQEVHGAAYWLLDIGALGTPQQIWILPSQNVTALREPQSRNVVDYYLYRTGAQEQRFRPDQIIHFRYPDPRSLYRRPLPVASLL